MRIRKQFKFCSGHIVRNCSSERCRKSLHGHNYIVEVFFTADKLDNGHMIMDFGLSKGTIKDFIDGFDHCWQMWSKENSEFKKFVNENSDRWIEMPVSPSAEQYSLLFFYVVDEIIKATSFNNGESNVRVHSVKVHETDTGYAEAFREDLEFLDYTLEDIVLSKQVQEEFKDPKMFDKLKEASRTNTKCFFNPKISQQVL
jgi:6-pyruvoyltetrahydropterin/6-carboxytetrahydropterin synthase